MLSKERSDKLSMLYVAVATKPSPIADKGIFVDEPVKKGQKVLKFDGPIISWNEAVTKGRENHVVPVDIDKYVDIYEPESLVNHSCDPTTGFSGPSTLIALRDLKKGDEITFDYSLVTADSWTMDCHCGAKNCRGKISDYADLPQDVKERHKDVTPKWIKKNYLLDKILFIIRESPGIRPSELNHRLGKEHTARYRQILINRGLIFKKKDGVAVRYYPVQSEGL